MPMEKVWHLEDKYTGQTSLSKYEDVAKVMDKDSELMLLSSLDDIAWLLNLRGNDIEFNPLFFSYVVFHKTDKRVDLFIEKSKTVDVADYLKSINVTVFDYNEV